MRDERAFDAGPIFIDSTDQLSHTFQVKNTSGSDLNITDIQKSCTCASATIAKQMLAPGETTDLRLVVNIRPIFDQWNVACRVLTDDPAEPERAYSLSYRTYPRVRFDVNTIRLGDVVVASGSVEQGGGVQSCWLEVYEPSDSEPDAIKSIQGRDPVHVTLEPEPDVDFLEDGAVRRTRYPVSVALASQSSMSSGVHTSSIVATTEAGHTASSIASWSVESPIKVTPSTTSFGIVDFADSPITRKVIVQSKDGRPIRLLAVEDSEDAGRFVEVHGVPSGTRSARHVISLDFRGESAKERFVAGKATILTDHPDTPEINLAWSAILKVAGPPDETLVVPGEYQSVSKSVAKDEVAP